MNMLANILKHRRIFRKKQTHYLATLVISIAVLAVAWVVVADPTHAASGGDTDRKSYITVVVADDNSDPDNAGTHFTLTWYDRGSCSADYNAYLYYKTEDGTEIRTHLGSATPSETQITQSLSRPNGGEFTAEVYCGTYNAETNQNPVTSVDILDECADAIIPGYACLNTVDGGPNTVGKPRPGTYSTAPPMTSLVVSRGNLDPAFHRGQLRYTIADVPSNTDQITLHAMAVNGSHFFFVKNATSDPVRGSCSQVVGYYWECEYSYGDNAVILSDADPSLPGIQLDLKEGESQFALHIRGGSEWNVRDTWSQMYRFTVTRTDSGQVVESPDNPDTSTPPDSEVGDESNPLTSLVVKPGTLTPAFARTEFSYTVTVVPSGTEQITLHAMAVNGAHFVFLKNPGWGVMRGCSGLSDGGWVGCVYGYVEGASVLNDAEPSTPGFQVNLDEGETQLGIHIHGGDVWDSAGGLYTLSVARAETEVQNNPATGQPTISGTAQVDETLTADTSGIYDADGLNNVAYSYQWLLDDADIQGATDSTYTLTDDDVGKAIKVRVSVTDDAGNDEALTSAATDTVVARPNSPATGAPTISGTAQAGETLTAITSGIADEDGLADATFSHQWIGHYGNADTDIEGATGSSYQLSASDLGKSVKVRVDFTDDAGHQESLTSQLVGPVDHQVNRQQSNSPATGAPTVSGAARAGETLTANVAGIADEDGLADALYSYQWLADDADIQGATGSIYTLTDDDVGKAIKVRVTFTDAGGHEETLTSAPTATVEAAEKAEAVDGPPGAPDTPTIERGDRELTISWTPPDDNGTAPVKGYLLEWRKKGRDYVEGDAISFPHTWLTYTIDKPCQRHHLSRAGDG